MKIKLVLVAVLASVFIFSYAACKEKEGAQPEGTASTGTAGGTSIAWMSYTDGMKKAAETHKPAMVDFYTVWCKYCKMLDETTYKDPEVIKMLNNDFVPIKVNAEGNAKVEYNGKTMTERDLAGQFKVTGYPTLWFFDQAGKPIAPLPGYSPPEDFKPVLTYITSGAYAKGVKFDDYLKSIKK